MKELILTGFSYGCIVVFLVVFVIIMLGFETADHCDERPRK